MNSLIVLLLDILKFCHHLLTLKLFQTGIPLLSSAEHKRVYFNLFNLGIQRVDGPHWLPCGSAINLRMSK